MSPPPVNAPKQDFGIHFWISWVSGFFGFLGFSVELLWILDFISSDFWNSVLNFLRISFLESFLDFFAFWDLFVETRTFMTVHHHMCNDCGLSVLPSLERLV